MNVDSTSRGIIRNVGCPSSSKSKQEKLPSSGKVVLQFISPSDGAIMFMPTLGAKEIPRMGTSITIKKRSKGDMYSSKRLSPVCCISSLTYLGAQLGFVIILTIVLGIKINQSKIL